MFRVLTAAGCLLTLIASALPGAAADGGAVSKGAAFLEVRLPVEARLEIDGTVTTSTGDMRWFRSPPLPVGKTYLYTLKATWQGKKAKRKIWVKADETVAVTFRPSDFVAADAPDVKAPDVKAPDVKAPADPGEKPAAKKMPPTREGFTLKEEDGRWWVFKAGSKDLTDFEKNGELAKHVTRINAAPYGVTMKAPDIETLEEYLTAKPGFVTIYEDGRLWVFKSGSKELDEYRKQRELAKHVTRIAAGPRGMTLKAPDVETVDAYLKASAQ